MMEIIEPTLVAAPGLNGSVKLGMASLRLLKSMAGVVFWVINIVKSSKFKVQNYSLEFKVCFCPLKLKLTILKFLLAHRFLQ